MLAVEEEEAAEEERAASGGDEEASLVNPEDEARRAGERLAARLCLEDDELHSLVARVRAEQARGGAHAAIDEDGALAEIEGDVAEGGAALVGAGRPTHDPRRERAALGLERELCDERGSGAIELGGEGRVVARGATATCAGRGWGRRRPRR